jgi:putative DNA primase/helicase
MKFEWRAVAHALGGQVAGNNTILVPGPGHSARDRSLAVRLDPAAPDGFLVFSHAGDDWKTCRDHVRARLGVPAWEPGDGDSREVPRDCIEKWDLAGTQAEIDSRVLSDDEVLRVAAACRIWRAGQDPRGTLAEKYLRDERKLELPHELAGSVLRFNPQCPWRNENTGKTNRVPALIVPFRSIDDGSITGVHRIALRDDGTKLGRRMLGITHRAAIMFDALDGDSLAIGEGVETAMAARQLGFARVWALGSVGAISFFPLIERVRELLILGESGDASACAIRLCGARWHRAGRQVRIAMPDIGSDFNDVLLTGASS